MKTPALSLLLVPILLLAACQPVTRPTTPETAVAGAGAAPVPAAGEAPATAVVATTTEPALPPPAAPELGPAKPVQAMVSGADVFARINRGLSPNSCDAGSNSERWRERYAGHPAAFARRIEEVLPLIDFVSTEVERAGLPSEFVFIPLVESWYQPGAIGPGGPAGMWQMIASTARNHGIHIKNGYDGRLSPVESTRAALSYLKVLQGMFGNWQSIVMAYNAGEGRMQHAFARANSRVASAAERRPHGLSNITYDYVAKLQALSCLVSQPSRQGLALPTETRFEPLVPLLMDEGIETLGEFARRNGKDAGALRRMNPGYRNGRVVAGVPRLVLAPPGIVPQAELASGSSSSEPEAGATMLAMSRVEASPDAIPSRHKVRPGESLWTIARLYNLPVDQLRRANRLGAKSMVHPGQVLRLLP
jgi:membrane-bound lytic murein transglycosylase D